MHLYSWHNYYHIINTWMIVIIFPALPQSSHVPWNGKQGNGLLIFCPMLRILSFESVTLYLIIFHNLLMYYL